MKLFWILSAAPALGITLLVWACLKAGANDNR